jgi:GGDEF domain-containing protein
VLAEKIRHGVESQSFGLGQNPIHLTISMGGKLLAADTGNHPLLAHQVSNLLGKLGQHAIAAFMAAQQGYVLAEKIRHGVESQSFGLGQNPIHLTISISPARPPGVEPAGQTGSARNRRLHGPEHHSLAWSAVVDSAQQGYVLAEKIRHGVESQSFGLGQNPIHLTMHTDAVTAGLFGFDHFIIRRQQQLVKQFGNAGVATESAP